MVTAGARSSSFKDKGMRKGMLKWLVGEVFGFKLKLRVFLQLRNILVYFKYTGKTTHIEVKGGKEVGKEGRREEM